MRLGYDILYLDDKKIVIKTKVKKLMASRGAYRFVVQLPKFWIEKKDGGREAKITIELVEK